MKQAVSSPNAPAALGPYSQAVISGDMVYCSGQTPIDPATGKLVDGGIAEQTQQVFRNLKAVLEAAGSSFDKVVKVTVFLADLANFATVNEIYAQQFTGVLPARSTFQVAALPVNAMVEIEMIAER